MRAMLEEVAAHPNIYPRQARVSVKVHKGWVSEPSGRINLRSSCVATTPTMIISVKQQAALIYLLFASSTRR